jgi:hypothetical protein
MSPESTLVLVSAEHVSVSRTCATHNSPTEMPYIGKIQFSSTTSVYLRSKLKNRRFSLTDMCCIVVMLLIVSHLNSSRISFLMFRFDITWTVSKKVWDERVNFFCKLCFNLLFDYIFLLLFMFFLSANSFK